MAFELNNKKIWVAGHRGMVGQALVRRLAQEGCDVMTVSREALDLRDQGGVFAWMEKTRPDAVFLAAATVGGIGANSTYPADFIYDNATIAGNVIHGAYLAGVSKLVFLGSSCIYPRDALQPISEDALLTGALEPTNQWYAVAKIAGLMMCQAYRAQYGCDFISAMPTNLYGPHDHFDPEKAHVIPSLMAKLHAAKAADEERVAVWGSGRPRREFLHVDDAAEALLTLMQHYSDASPVNIGCGEDISIRELALMLAEVVGYAGELVFDGSKPDGTPRKLLDVSKMRALGWEASCDLREGLEATYAWYAGQFA